MCGRHQCIPSNPYLISRGSYQNPNKTAEVFKSPVIFSV